MRHLLLVLVLIAALVAPFSRPAPAHAAGQILEWETGPGFATFGANAAVTIALGTINFDCDFIFPTANVYVIQGSPSDGSVLVDVSGSPNTVVGATGGVFTDTIAFTQPSGTLGEGVYTVVYDECQDGSFDEGTDAAFVDAFEVVLPSTLPPIDPSIGALKAQAGQLADRMQTAMDLLELYEAYQEIQEAIECITSPAECVVSMIVDEITGAILDQIKILLGLTVDPKLAARDAALDTISHWEGIEADPPDPAFDQHTLIERPAAIDPESGDLLVVAEVALGNAHLTEGALAKALLHAIERYQGAQIADDGDWTLVHAREVRNFATLMDSQLIDSNTAIFNLVNALTTDPRDIDQVSASLSGDRQRIVATGFLPNEERLLLNLGLTQTEMDDLRTRIADAGTGSVSESQLVSALNDLAAANTSARSTIQALAGAMDAVIDAILVDTATDDGFPVADAGGPYAAAEGDGVTLDGSNSDPIVGTIVTYDWDLDGDGAFDDATSATPTVSFAEPLDGFVGLRVTDDRGFTGVAYAAVAISATNSPPVITSVSPVAFHPEILVGTSQTFTVDATDPDGDAITITWLLDGESAGSGSSFTYTPLEADGLGGHWLRAAATAGGDTRVYDWTPLVLLPDADADDWHANVDCDDADATVNPDQTEVLGNGKDDDCDTSTPDAGDGPIAFFNPVINGGGSNAASYEDGARTVSSAPAAFLVQQMPDNMLDEYIGIPAAESRWQTSGANHFAIVDLVGDEPVVIDRVSVRGNATGFSVRTFEVDISTTTTDASAFTNILSGVVVPSSTTHEFALPAPVLAKYIRFRPTTSVQMTTLLQVWTGQAGTNPTVTFDNLSTDANGDIVSYLWDFGDGSPTSAEASPTHTFPGVGEYTVSLTVTDAIGNTSVFTAIQQVLPPDPEPDILIYGPSVAGGATSPEYAETIKLGLTPYVIEHPDWLAMTTEEFAGYRAIIFGDASWVTSSPTLLNMAATNGAAWGPAITGNIMIQGSDTAVHLNRGSGVMISRSIEFAIAQPGKTGATIMLGQYYFNFGANTVVPVLEVLRPGGFTVQGEGCDDGGHFTATHPAFAGLTDANLGPWACAIHETFNRWPSDFEVIAIGRNLGTHVNTDGSIGRPYIVASGTEIVPIRRITLSPEAATNTPGSVQTLTATVRNDTTPAPNVTVTFTITAGPHATTTGTAITDANGVATFSYTGSQAGTDDIVASFENAGVTLSSNIARVTWSQPALSLDAGPDQTITEGGSLSLSAGFSNGDPLATHTATIDWGDGTTEAGAVTEADGIGTVSGAHSYPDDGISTVKVCLTASSGPTDCDTLTVTVNNAAPAVTANTVPDQVAGATVTFDLVTFTDAGTLDTHSATIDWGDGSVDAGAVTQGTGAGSVSGSHAYATGGSYTVTITVADDDGDSDGATLTIDVANANGEPVLNAIADQTLDEGTTLTVTITALDPDGETVTLTQSGLPPFATLTSDSPGTATLALAPDFDDAGTYPDITITASDGTLTASATFTITVTNVNRPPDVDANGPYSVDEGDSVTVAATGSDPDGDALTFAWDLDNDGIFETSGASATVSAATLDGPDSRAVTVQVSDGNLMTTAQTTVTIVNVNPTIASVTSDSPINEGGSSTIVVTAGDPAGASDPLSFQFDCDGNDVYEIGPQATATATCPYPDSGIYAAGVLVSDGDGGTATGTTVVTVEAVNTQPSIDANGPYSVDEGGSVTVNATGNDPDNDVLSFAWDMDNNGSFETTGASATFSASLIDGPATASIHAQACDPDGACATDTASVTIVNLAPVIDPIVDSTLDTGQAIEAQATWSDFSGEVSWSISVDYGDGTVEHSTATAIAPIALAHTYATAGNYTLSVCVDDGTDSACQAADVHVLDPAVNVPPVVDAGSTIALMAGQPISSTGSFADPDSTTWIATVDYGDGSGDQPLTLNPDGTFALAHTYLTGGNYTITVCVTDGNGATGCDTTGVTAERYAIFAGRDDCGSDNLSAIHWSGSKTVVNGDVHSNSGLTVSGSKQRVDGSTTYRCDKHISGSQHTFTEGVTQTGDILPWPVQLTVDDFDCDISVSGKLDLSKDGEWWVGGRKTSRQLKPLTLCATEITLSGSSISGTVTLVAGTIRISGSNLQLTADQHGVLAFATGGNTAIKISGSGDRLAGDLVARAGQIDLPGSSNNLDGSVVGWTVKLTGSGWRIGVE